MAHAFQQVMNQLGTKQFNSSAYHLKSQEALERFHQTLKTMIKMYCIENSRDWDELVFGHAVSGPLLLLKEKLLDEDSEKTRKVF